MGPLARQRSQSKYESLLDGSQQSDEEEMGDSFWGPLTQVPSGLVDHHAADVNLVRMRAFGFRIKLRHVYQTS
jgi:hypothetical protein